MKNDKLIVFQDRTIRRVWHESEWYFSVVDMIQVLTDSNNPRNYWSMLKKREKETCYGRDIYLTYESAILTRDVSGVKSAVVPLCEECLFCGNALSLQAHT